jgi:RNA polymerase sigma-70 factor (TIGR02960 family)
VSPLSAPVIELARGGSEEAFRELTAPHLGELRLHCYRMLGSLDDAEDLLQETLTAAWSGLADFAGRSTVRVWLYRIATNRCLNAIRDARRRRPPEPVPPFAVPEPSRRGEVRWLQPCPEAWLDDPSSAADPAVRYEAREAVALAFVAALQRLAPRQTAVLLLCDVLGYAVAEVADMLGVTPTAVKGTLQRARASLRRGHAGGDEEAPSPGSAEERELAERFATAFSADDIEGVVALLTDDAWLSMPPAPHQYHGRAAITAFLAASHAGRGERRLRLLPTRANGQPAFGWYIDDLEERTRRAGGIVVLTLAGGCVRGITRFLDASLPARFGLPGTIPATGASGAGGRSSRSHPYRLAVNHRVRTKPHLTGIGFRR